MGEIKRVYKQKGRAIQVKYSIDEDSLSPKQILETIETTKDNIKKCVGEIGKNENNVLVAQKNIEGLNLDIPRYQKDLKNLSKFEDWAMNYQLSSLKNLIEEVKDDAFNVVTAEYKFDKALNDEGNSLQKFKMYQMKLATNKKIAEAVAQSVINDYFILECKVDNPFK